MFVVSIERSGMLFFCRLAARSQSTILEEKEKEQQCLCDVEDEDKQQRNLSVLYQSEVELAGDMATASR